MKKVEEVGNHKLVIGTAAKCGGTEGWTAKDQRTAPALAIGSEAGASSKGKPDGPEETDGFTLRARTGSHESPVQLQGLGKW